MRYMIVYSSITGNTETIAKAIKDTLDEKYCVYYGSPSEVLTQEAGIIFVGFWVYKGSCPEEIKKYLQTLKNKKIFLFGTAGFGGSNTYFETILKDVKENISASNSIIDCFLCQGKMPHKVLERYKKMLIEQPKNSSISDMITNYENALSHPDIHDIEAAKAVIRSWFSEILK